jgi:hypothetical protein
MQKAIARKIKEIRKITLREDEFLIIQVGGTPVPLTEEELNNILQNLENFFPKDWYKRIIIVKDHIKFIKLKKEDIPEYFKK